MHRLIYSSPENRRPTEKQLLEAAEEGASRMLLEIKKGRFSNRPLVCFFEERGDKLAIMWPTVIQIRIPNTNNWVYAGTYTRELELEVRNHKAEELKKIREHADWFQNCLNQAISQYLNLEEVFEVYMLDRYKITITEEAFINWKFKQNEESLDASLLSGLATLRYDDANQVIWIEDCKWKFPEIKLSFNLSVIDKDLHLYCRDTIEEQIKIEDLLSKESQPIQSNTLSSTERQQLEKFVVKRKVEAFWQIEKRLKDAGYIFDSNKWQKNALELVELIALLKANDFFLLKLENQALKRDFEERYGCKIPSKYLQPIEMEKRFLKRYRERQLNRFAYLLTSD